MRSGRLFWGALILLVGLLFLLQNLGIVTGSIWGIIWPLVIILIGLQLLFGRVLYRNRYESQQLSIPLEGERQAAIEFQHGAGRLTVRAGSDPNLLLSGVFNGGVQHSSRREGDRSRITLSSSAEIYFGFPWFFGPPPDLNWDVTLNPSTPLDLEFKTGASKSELDLRQLKVQYLRLGTGASSTDITLPENAGITQVRVSAGAASIGIRIPDKVAGRIEAKGGIASIHIDTTRFSQSGNVYQSSDFETAANRADIFIEAGVGSIDIR
ncbi:MAG: DUF5668 domain-containing protein [Chloroflexi bacterium]|nr:DUF5668 domain-containing protein [Chloroflexota bacterium]